MAKFEFKTMGTAEPQYIEADDYSFDMSQGRVIFFDRENRQIATYAITDGAYVKRADAR